MKTQNAGSMKRYPVVEPSETFDLPSLLEMVKREDVWKTSSRNAVTLLNDQKMRVVLVAMHENSEIQGHRVDCPISVQVIAGEIEFRVDEKIHHMKQGQLLTLQPGIDHGITATKESAYLLTLATNQSHPVEN